MTLLSNPQEKIRHYAIQNLTRSTYENFQEDQEKWRTWCKENKDFLIKTIDALIPALNDPQQKVRALAMQTLEHLLDRSLGMDPEKWQTWWKESENILKGDTDGVIKEYYPGGELKEEKIYKGGKEIYEGVGAKSYYKSGKLKMESLPDSTKDYYENGKLMTESLRNKNNGFDISKSYFESGKLKSEMNYIEGAYKYYDENGKITSEGKLEDLK